MFRYIFCTVNNQPDRLLTADCKTFYTTLDEIFEETDSNKIYQVYDYNYLSLVHDVFVYISGPRLRDKLSHGEIDVESLDQNVVKVLLILVSYGVVVFDNKVCPAWLKCVETYKCLYHKNAVFLKHLQDVLFETQTLHNILTPEDFKLNLTHNKYSTSTINISAILDHITNLPVSVFFRPKIEKELVTILNQIMENLFLSIKNFKDSLDIKYKAFVERTLRSKRRATYRQLLQFLPDFYGAVLRFCGFLLRVFEMVQEDNEEKTYTNLLRFLKSMLQCAENLTKYLHSEHNKWNESLTMIDRTFEDMKFLGTELGLETYRRLLKPDLNFHFTMYHCTYRCLQ
ncbi:endoplasmic reticulum membrane-associated RNA degradation protein-like [Ctenocephalides felis]|uniref:endoplasmic reticulum membrane-associated RNA degradation protein-like n=1 Tax=Ctenocephalides felis TaxID=7515 RepID=UPI000E6E2BE6|nr:endoplasmic reticulum membrane-associated RNA degradation protein-like [Ctenocephalides felis]